MTLQHRNEDVYVYVHCSVSACTPTCTYRWRRGVRKVSSVVALMLTTIDNEALKPWLIEELGPMCALSQK